MSVPSDPLPREAGRRLRLVGGDAAGADLCVGAYLSGWLASRRSLRPSTVLAYEIHLRRHLVPALGEVRLADLSPETIDAFYADLLAGRTGVVVSTSTVRRIHATLMSALNAAVRRGLLTSNPAQFVDLARGWSRSRRVWDGDEVARFLAHAAGDRLFAVMVVLVVCRLRRGEALGLRWVDVDLEAGELRVEQQIVAVGATTHLGPPKSAHGRRRIALAGSTVGVLHAHRARQEQEHRSAGDAWQDTGLVFTDLWGRPLSPPAVSRRFDQMITTCGLPRIRLHDLRHSSASLGLASGESLFEVSRRLGHSSIGVTADVYAHLIPAVTHRSAQRLAEAVMPDRHH